MCICIKYKTKIGLLKFDVKWWGSHYIKDAYQLDLFLYLVNPGHLHSYVMIDKDASNVKVSDSYL